MSPRTGRPLSENGKKDKLLQVRMDDTTLAVLDECTKKTKLSKSEVVRKGISLFSESLKK